MTMLKRYGLVAVVVCIAVVSPEAQSVGETSMFKPNPGTQQLIAELARERAHEGAHVTSAFWRESVDRLVTATGGDRIRLLQELIYRAATNQGDEVVPIFILQIALREMDFRPEEHLTAMIPLLEHELESVRRNAERWLQYQVEKNCGDFSEYRNLLQRARTQSQEADARLVQHMFHRDPGRALLTFADVHLRQNPQEKRTVLMAEHVISDLLWRRQHEFEVSKELREAVTKEMKALASMEWWTRAYVAQILRQHPDLAEASIGKQLAQEQHPVVRAILSEKAPTPMR